jgi:hypothetical protein
MRFPGVGFPCSYTGHMAGFTIVSKKPASIWLLLFPWDVRFDLFHGNWPYMGDLLSWAELSTWHWTVLAASSIHMPRIARRV